MVRPVTDYVTPRALETSEIPGIVEAFRKGAKNANLLALTVWRYTGPMATCSISSCRTGPISFRRIWRID